jgi:hypothetical protein
MGKREKLSAENTEPAEQTEAAESSPTVTGAQPEPGTGAPITHAETGEQIGEWFPSGAVADETPYTGNPLAGGEPGEPTGVRWSVPPESETVERVPVEQDAGAEDDQQAD